MNKGNASINKRQPKYELKKSKIITDSDSEEEVKEKEKKKIKYPKDDYDSYDSLSPYKSKDKEKNKKKKKLKKEKSKKNLSTVKIKNISDDDTDDNTTNTNIKHVKRNKKKKKTKNNSDLDIEMRDETQKGNVKYKSINKEDYLPCREKEQEKIYTYIKTGLETDGNYNSLYIAGMPGTGKTACVKKVIEILENEFTHNKNETSKFSSLFLCGTEYPNIRNIYRDIYKFIFSNNKKIRNRKYQEKLDRFFFSRDTVKAIYLENPSNSHIIIVVDEIDFLINKDQNFLYNLFNWSTYENSRLIIITISNTLDLPNRLKPKIRSRMGSNIIMFKPYDKEQLITIIKSKGIEFEKFTEDAIKLSCMKVSAINGDLRRTFQILLRAKELFNLESTRKSVYKKIDKDYIVKASEDLFNSKLSKGLGSLQICEKILICAILARTKDTNNKKINVGNLYNKLEVFFNKYNNANKDDKIELYWEEYKNIIYKLIRLQIINYSETPKLNFIENCIEIKFYVDEFINVCIGDKILKPVLDYLISIINV